jgi:hypothetical protein
MPLRSHFILLRDWHPAAKAVCRHRVVVLSRDLILRPDTGFAGCNPSGSPANLWL